MDRFGWTDQREVLAGRYFLNQLAVGKEFIALDCQLIAARRMIGHVEHRKIDDQHRFAARRHVERQLDGANRVLNRQARLVLL